MQGRATHSALYTKYILSLATNYTLYTQASGLLKDSSIGSNPINLVITKMQIHTIPQVRIKLFHSDKMHTTTSEQRVLPAFRQLRQNECIHEIKEVYTWRQNLQVKTSQMKRKFYQKQNKKILIFSSSLGRTFDQ